MRQLRARAQRALWQQLLRAYVCALPLHSARASSNGTSRSLRNKFLSSPVGHAGTSVQVGVGDAAPQLAVSAATVAVQVESVAVSVAAPALQQSCTPAALVAGTDVPAQCTVQSC